MLLMSVVCSGSLWCLLHLSPMYVVGGYYLAFFFSLSHNFEGVHMLDDTTREGTKGEKSFLYKQVGGKGEGEIL